MQTPSASLNGRRIVLGVTGGIAAYKAADLVRRLKDAGADVQVVMTVNAQRFVTAQTFQALSGRPVRSSLWDEAAEAAMGHIELARWPDLILIAPASASTIARLAHGLADDLLSTLCLASDRPLAVAPSMNRLMWAHPATQANLHTLIQRGVQVFGPGSGDQACGEVGEGRMWEPVQIRDAVAALLHAGPLSGVRVVLTAGPTREPIDPVRFITNRSSGKMGYALAEALAHSGAEVTLVSGPTALAAPGGVRRVEVETAAEMLEATQAAAASAQILVGAAAVADYRLEAPAAHKIKKKTETLDLALVKNPDILSEARRAHPRLFIVGFAAETEKLAEHARDKLARKKLDLIAANWVGNGRAFERDDNALHVFWDGGERELAHAPKPELARALAALIAERYHAARGRIESA
ncbi:MAG: bifunctional phosphopantothenoylcysteine decarboxylase/phosphopantothenate--cysteine ligase CoaBC [Gammaproteobacteria bacterium]